MTLNNRFCFNQTKALQSEPSERKDADLSESLQFRACLQACGNPNVADARLDKGPPATHPGLLQDTPGPNH